MLHKTCMIFGLVLAAIFANHAFAVENPSYLNSQFTSKPVNLSGSDVNPLVMINASRDHQLSYKAYNDFSDLDGDGTPETTYSNTIDYYGYFDSAKCYTYSKTDNRFVPAALAIATTVGGPKHYCSGQWSGNFMNWATMTRMDTVRKMLYGGKRSIGQDTVNLTVLERHYLPTDAHSFAKYYNGDDLYSLTPFTKATDGVTTLAEVQADSTTTIAMPTHAVGTADVSFSTTPTLSTAIGDQVKIFVTGNPSIWMTGAVTVTGATITVRIPAGGYSGTGTYSAWRLQNETKSQTTGITLANLTFGSTAGYRYSDGNNNPPLIRVAKGNYALWAANERWQCYWSGEKPASNGNDPSISGIYAGAANPSQTTHGLGTGSATGEYYARIEVANSSWLGNERVKKYGTTYKPIGLLQVYGDDDQISFGLMTGTFAHNISGGVLRKNASSFTNEIKSADGTFLYPTDSIIKNLDNLRLYGYDYDDGLYNYHDNCPFQLTNITEGNCSSWGNPMSEAYLESLRYLAGNSANTNFSAGAKDTALGLTVATWVDPLTTSNYCAPLNVLNFNASVSSYDGNNMGGTSSLNTAPDAKVWTDTIGNSTHENLIGSNWFIGNNGVDNNELCTAKDMTSTNGFGSYSGLCPEAPTQSGTYLMAGTAYYANTTPIRTTPAIPASRNATRDYKVSTYGIALATNVPKIEITTASNKKVTILPAYRLDMSNAGTGAQGGGTLVDFKIIRQNSTEGSYYISWEDSEMGGDYDQDVWGTIKYSVSGDTVTVTTDIIEESTNHWQGFGYIISGTDHDGVHFPSGIEGWSFADTTPGAACTNCQVADGPRSVAYTASGTSAGLLNDPLWYTAKYGGFIDEEKINNYIPDLTSEWDSINNDTGAIGADTKPDNFFYASNPLQLENQLSRVFLDILKRASSGTAAAVVANNVSGDGAIYQAYYEPSREDGTNKVSWIGTVQALWLDKYGYIREDSGGTLGAGNAVLDDYSTDPVIQQFYDETASKTRVRRYASTKSTEFAPNYMVGRVTSYNYGTGAVEFKVEEFSGTGPWTDWDVTNLSTKGTGTSKDTATVATTVGSTASFVVEEKTTPWFTIGDRIQVAHFQSTVIDLENVRTLWNARKKLSFSTAYADVQRDFDAVADDTASGGRHIITWMDTKTNAAAANGIVETSEVVPFTRSSITPANYGFFNMATEADAENLVDYVRGKEISGYRNRTIKYDGTTSEVIRLGDVVNSTPTLVGDPKEEFHTIYKDTTYGVFKRQYLKRRQVLYVGSNDGMLHAFNGGFYDSTTNAFSVNGKKWDKTTPAVAHPLGSELWAYVPMNLLPHLKWLKDPKYAHVYYMDAKPRVFDAKIFDDTELDHPGGWGTVMVVGMRMGGGKMDINIADAIDPADTRAFRSAYVIMDITNPEVPPKLLAEIQVPDDSFSTSYPTAVTIKDVSSTSPNKWFLLFGSGPTNISLASSTGSAKFYAFDLDEIRSPGTNTAYPTGCESKAVGSSGTMKIISCDTGIANSFVGNPVSVDWDLDFKGEAAYFGVVGDTASTSGQVMRFAINEEASPANWVKPATLINTSQPVVSAVTPTIDKSGKKWVFFGTGRFFVGDDQLSKAPPQSIYGVKDENGALVKKTDLINVTAAQVKTDGSFIAAVDGSANIKDLETKIDTATTKGWYRDLPPIVGTAGTDPATRVINASPLTGGVLFTAAYQPGSDVCTGEGASRLYALYYKTGTAYPDPAILGTVITGINTIARPFVELGRGFAASPSVHSGTGSGSGGVTVQTQMSTGTVVSTKANTVTKVRSGMTSWIEPR